MKPVVEPEYRRRARIKAEHEERARHEREDTQRHVRETCIARTTISRIEEASAHAEQQQASHHKQDHFLHWLEVIALATAAAVGVAAICYGTSDSHQQRNVMIATLKEMQAEQRPWVYATEVKVAGRINLEEGRYFVPLKITVTNTGRLPAFFVQNKTGAKPLQIGLSTTTVKNDACDHYRKSLTRSGQTIFAGQAITYGGFTPEDYPSFPQIEWDALKSDRIIVLYGCIDYQFPDQPGHHQSRFSFAVGRRNDVGILTRIGSLPDDPAAVEPHLLPVTIGDDRPAD